MPAPDAATSSSSSDASRMPRPAPPNSSGRRDADPAGVGERLVEVPGELLLLIVLGPVVVVEAGREIGYRALDRLLIIGELEVHASPPAGCERPFTQTTTNDAVRVAMSITLVNATWYRSAHGLPGQRGGRCLPGPGPRRARGAVAALPGPEPATIEERAPYWRSFQRAIHEAGLRRAVVAEGVRRARRVADRAGDLPAGVRPRGRARPAQHARRGPRGADDHRLRHRRAQAPLPASRSCAATRSGASCSPSPTPARTSPRSRHAPSATATAGGSPARRSGPAARTSPRTGCCSRAPAAARATAGITYFLLPMDSRGRDDPPAAPHARRGGVQRGLPRRRLRARRPADRRGRRRLEGRDGHALLRARRARHRPRQHPEADRRADRDGARRRGHADDPAVRRKLASLYARAQVQRVNGLRALASMEKGTPGPETSIGKLFSAPLVEEIADFALSLSGLRRRRTTRTRGCGSPTRRAAPRSPAARPSSSATSSPSACSACPR